MTPFRSAPAGYVARWEPVEREVLARVARDVAELVRADSGIGRDVEVGDGVAFTGVGRVPSDPAVQRLLPDAHRDDPEVAEEFRHLTQTDLAAGKVARLEAFVARTAPDGAGLGGDDAGAGDEPPADAATLEVRVHDEVVVPREEAQDFAGALTDLRLVLAERLGLEDDEDVEDLHDDVLTGLDDDAAPADDADDAGAHGDLTADERRYWGGVFVAAGFAQETLVTQMLEDLRAGR